MTKKKDWDLWDDSKTRKADKIVQNMLKAHHAGKPAHPNFTNLGLKRRKTKR